MVRYIVEDQGIKDVEELVRGFRGLALGCGLNR